MMSSGSRISNVATIFSITFIKEILSGKSDARISSLAEHFVFARNLIFGGSYFSFFQEAYSLLCAEYRSEYVYKNELVNSILECHSANNLEVTILSEFSLDTAIADIVAINGKAIAYEIKAENDNLSRLARQINIYKSVFANTAVITYPENADRVMKLVPENTGIFLLQDLGNIFCARQIQEDDSLIDGAVIFPRLRKSEQESILREYYGDIPDFPIKIRFMELRSLFTKIPKEILKVKTEEILKSRKQDNHFVGSPHFPPSLHLLLSYGSLRKDELKTLAEILNGKERDHVLPHALRKKARIVCGA